MLQFFRIPIFGEIGSVGYNVRFQPVDMYYEVLFVFEEKFNVTIILYLDDTVRPTPFRC